MKHLRSIPKLGVRPKKLIFVCPSCKEVEGRELIANGLVYAFVDLA
jgi:hypothetical protein